MFLIPLALCFAFSLSNLSTLKIDEKGYDVNRVITAVVNLEIKTEINKKIKTNNITIGLFGESVPITVLNFLAFVKGFDYLGRKFSYKDVPIHKIVKDFIIQTGDAENFDGSGRLSAFGGPFRDESFNLSHRGGGWVSMANSGSNSNGCQFFILNTKARWLDGKHVVFGKVIKGMDIINIINDFTTDDDNKPIDSITITNSYPKTLIYRYYLTEFQMESTKDLATTTLIE